MIDPQELAEAVAHWLRFEELCQRRVLFTERHMSHAIGQYLIGRHGEAVAPEVPHPAMAQKRIDFGIRTEDGKGLTDVIETKLVTEDRDFQQEIFTDLIRLSLACEYLKDGGAWLMIAGMGQHINQWVVHDNYEETEQGANAQPIEGDGFTIYPSGSAPCFQKIPYPFQHVLAPFKRDDSIDVELGQTTGNTRQFWCRAISKCGGLGPVSFTSQLCGRWVFDEAFPEDQWMCFVWRITRAQPFQRIDADGFCKEFEKQDTSN